MCLVHAKIRSLIEIITMWWKGWKFVCVKFWCDEKIGNLKKKLGSKPDLNFFVYEKEGEGGTYELETAECECIPNQSVTVISNTMDRYDME